MVLSDVRSWDPDSYGGLGFVGENIAEFKHLFDYIEDRVKEVKSESMPDAGSKLLETMTCDVSKFYSMVCLYNSPDQIYYEIPIFKYIAPDEFVKALLLINPEDRKNAIFALDKRYQFPDINKRLVEELTWLEQVREEMIKEQQKKNGKMSGYFLKSNIEHYMDKFIK